MAASTSENFLPDRSGAREPVPAPPSGTTPAPMRRRTPRHEIRALLRAHLAAASGYRHLTRHCAVCARLLRLAMEPLTASGATGTASTALEGLGPHEAPLVGLAGPGPHEPTQAGPTRPGPHEPPQTGPTSPGPPGTASAPPAGPGSSVAAPPATAAPEPPPEQTGVHVMPSGERVTPSGAREQTVRPVTGPRPTPSPATGPGPIPSPATGPASTHFAAPDIDPHALARRPASVRTTTRLVPARASASPGGGETSPGVGDPGPGVGDPGPGGPRGPRWAEDESPPAA